MLSKGLLSSARPRLLGDDDDDHIVVVVVAAVVVVLAAVHVCAFFTSTCVWVCLVAIHFRNANV